MSLKDQQVLVTGSTGMVGSNIVERLLSEGAKVRATLHEKDPVIDDPRVEYVKVDLALAEDCRKVVKDVRYMFHVAAVSRGGVVLTNDPMDGVIHNTVMNARMLEAAYDAHVEKYLWLSSNTGYPPAGDLPVQEDTYMDGDPFFKSFNTGWMKRYGGILCQMYGEKLPRKMTTIVLRPSNIYGPRDDFEPHSSHSTPATIRKVVERHDPIEVWGDGEDIKDLIYIEDFLDAMILSIEKLNSYTVMNIGSGDGFSINDLLQAALTADGFEDANIVYDASKPTMIPIRLMDISRARSLIGFDPKTSLAEGVKKTIDWYRETRGLPRPAGAGAPN